MPQLSIIVPVYNVEPYLSRCLDSILAQTFSDFEAILIDDGSPDNCGEIMDGYAARDSRFIVIHQANQGVSAARNAGLQVARGKYVGFVDPDDWIEKNMYESMVRAIESANGDIVSCSWYDNHEESGSEKAFISGIKSAIMTQNEYTCHLFDAPPTIAGSACFKLFKRELITEGFNTVFSICEDNYFVIQYCMNVHTAAYINEPLYHVFFRKESATRNNPMKVALGLPARKAMIISAKKISSQCEMRAEKLFLDQCIAFCGSSKPHEDQYYQLAKKEFIKYITENKYKVLKNREMSVKMKVFFTLQYVRLIFERN